MQFWKLRLSKTKQLSKYHFAINLRKGVIFLQIPCLIIFFWIDVISVEYEKLAAPNAFSINRR